MTIQFVGAGGLFTRIGKFYCAMDELNLCVGTLIPTAVNQALATYDPATIPFRNVVANTAQLTISLPTTNQGLQQNMSQVTEGTIVGMVNADAPQLTASIGPALAELIRQMIATANTVQANTVGAVASIDAAVGNGTLIVTTKRADGLVNQQFYTETITVVARSTSSLAFAGELNAGTKIQAAWPLGSGASATLQVIGIGGQTSLVTNSSFETDATTPGQPDGWIVDVGTPGTTVYLTDVEVQTLTIAGSPTAGTYLLTYTSLGGDAYPTVELAWNTQAGAVQAALAALPGLGGVTVTQSGTAPNWVFTVTFNGVGGNLNLLTVTSRLNTGTITPAQVTAGSSFVYAGGRALALKSNGVQLISVLQRLTLARMQQYACGVYLAASPAGTGEVTIDLYDGQNTITDEQGTPNEIVVDIADLASAYALFSGFFRTPNVIPPAVYLRIRFSTAVSNNTVVYADAVSLGVATTLYSGGPSAAVVGGNVAFAVGDQFSIATTNNFAGAFQNWFERCFSMSSQGLQLPCSLTPTIPDSLACGGGSSSSSSV